MIVSLLVPLQVLALAAPAHRSDSALIQATRYEYSTESKSEGPTAANTSGRYVATFTDRHFRVDVLESTGPDTPGKPSAGSFMLSRDRQVYSIDTVKHEYYEFSPEKLKQQMGEMMKAVPGMQMKFSGFKFDVTDLGDGENILDHPTRRWKIRQLMNVTTIMMGDTISISMETTQETWSAKDMFGPGNPMTSVDSGAVSVFGDLIPAAELAGLRASMAKMPKGLPLKSASHTTSYFGPMDVTLTMNTQVTKIEKVRVPASLFELPKGYKLVDLPTLKPR
jgi:hypothetical protein